MSPPRAAGLYLHIPFCSAICPYCDFAVRVGGEDQRREYFRVLLLEIEAWGTRYSELSAGVLGAESFDTIYLGGGTPSLLPPELLAELFAALRMHLPIARDAWLFLEANPEDITRRTLDFWRALGVRFLSLGVQSFDEETLHFLGRRHSPAEAVASVEQALAAGFETVSIDLIYALPGQDDATWQRQLEQALTLGVDHLSCYGLEVHPATPFGKAKARGTLEELGQDHQADLFLLTHRTLAEGGLEGYEVSNFAASPEHRSRHNQKYWHHVPYLGLGPSAHSLLGDLRFWNERQMPTWRRKILAGESGEAGREQLTPGDRTLETLMLSLRTRRGVDLGAFERDFAIDLAGVQAKRIEALQASGKLELVNGFLRPTLEGMANADALAALLVDGVL